MIRFVRITVSLVICMAGGVGLTSLILRQPVNMPEFLDDGIRAVLNWTGHAEMANADDMADIAFIAILLASFAVCALIVWLANIAMSRGRRTDVADGT